MLISDIIHDIAQYMQMRNKIGNRRYHLLLACQQDMHWTAKGYYAIASLMRENYFSTILTIGCEGVLEQVLQYLDGSPWYKKLVVGQDANEHIIDALDDEENACIIMLDQIRQQGQGRRVSLTPEIRAALQRYLNQEIVIAGSIEYEEDLLKAFQVQKENAIYYVLPADVILQDRLNAILNQQGKWPLFVPPSYTFDTFFEALAVRLIPNYLDVVWKARDLILPVPVSIPALVSTPVPVPVSTSVLVSIPAPVSAQPSPEFFEELEIDLLLVTTTPIETWAILTSVAKKRKITVRNRAYHDLDVIGGAKTCLVQLPHMGTNGSGGSLKTIEAAIDALSPWAVIMVGIAFGFDPINQHIGDILVSQQIQGYDLERVGSGPSRYPRGNRVSASAVLLGNFITSQYYVLEDWQDAPKVYPGLILSGSKLVDDVDFRNQLRMAAPNAIGGEMEGVGLYEAAFDKHVDWLLVKGISDWGDGEKNVNKDVYQRLAAENAARFTIKVIELGGFTKPSK